MLSTRPNINFVMGVVSYHLSKPDEQHSTTLKCIMRYIQRTFAQVIKVVHLKKVISSLLTVTYSNCVGDATDLRSNNG